MTDVANPDPGCLHLVAAAGGNALRDCLARSQQGDTILFLDAGVLHLLDPGFPEVEGGGAALVYASADLAAYGLAARARAAGATAVDDAGFCELLAAHRHCLTWT